MARQGITTGTIPQPAYRERLTLKELYERADALLALVKECRLCPRACGARRLEGRYGVCHATNQVMISGAAPHFGEEPVLVGRHGSGTIFFSSCNLKCLFCQNYDISHLRSGRSMSIDGLAEVMLSLQAMGCHNINLVTPTHFTAQIVQALALAAERGLRLPMVYNCGGYESVETLALLDGIVDIYMPDIKYSDNRMAKRWSGVADYWDVVRPAVKEMHRQVGDLRTDEQGIARRGLIVRHLVLPNDIAGSLAVLEFVAREISSDTYINIMDQYHPEYKARTYPQLNRRIRVDEYERVISYARNLGLHRGFGDEEAGIWR
jgi:putative pyruvate formate lyase activating enzyme